LLPNGREGHRKSEEAVFDKRVFCDAGFSEEGLELAFGEKVHVVISGPAFADQTKESVEAALGEYEVEEWDACMELNRETAVGCGEIAALGDACHLAEESKLAIAAAHMLDDGVGIGDIKSVVGEGECGAVARDSMDGWITFGELAHVALSNGSDTFWMSVVFFEVVVGRRIFLGVDPDISDGLFGRRRDEREKLREFPFAAGLGYGVSEEFEK
jgi:hypothetical protein